ncbi:hypothetical protein JCM16303_003533 [Sporobolomyces ruberrimus]
MNDPAPYSPQMSSPRTPWSDAHSTFGNSPYLDSSRTGSSTSLWTASSASSIVEDDEDVSSELRCLELLAELEREKRRKSVEEKRDQRNFGQARIGQGSLHARDESLPDVVQPLDLNKARAARNAKYANSSNAPVLPAAQSNHSTKTQRVSRRASFTTTDLSELDIDSILDAYVSQAMSSPRIHEEATFQPSIPRSKNSFNLQREIQPQGVLPPIPSSLHRNSTAFSIRSTRSTRSNGSTQTANDDRRKAGPFPTITRQRSNGSLASRKLPFDPTTAPPLPSGPPPFLPTSVPMSNRTFSSFSRESTASTASSSSAHSLPMRSIPGPSRMSCASSTMSRQTSSTSTTNSLRWSVATASTAPTCLSDGSSDCGASRRGSLAPSSVGSFKQSPNRSRRRPSAPFPGSPIEQDEDESYWGRRESKVEQEEEEDLRDGGLISWEDFADELASLPVPNRPNPRRMNSQGSSASSRSRHGSNASPFKPSYQAHPSNHIFTSPESLRSTATLTSLSSSNSVSPFPTSSSPSPTDSRSGKNRILHGLKGMKSTRDLASSFAQ